MRLEDVLVIAKEDTTVKFNFRRGGNLENWEGAASSNLLRAPKLTEAVLNEAWMQQ